MDENEQAVLELKALAKVPGALRIITNEPDPDRPADATMRTPQYFKIRPVVKLEGPNHRGQYTALSEEYEATRTDLVEGKAVERTVTTRDNCTGQPAALLTRLQQWRTEAHLR